MKALITGASSGIGRDIARYLHSLGWELIVTARRKDRLEELASELVTGVRLIEADLSRVEDCFALYESTRGEGIDMLVNNAGFGIYGRFTETDLRRELDLLAVNAAAPHILTKLFLRDFVRRDSGIILNVVSSAAFAPGPLLSSYYASKAYLLRLSQAISEELRRQGSHVRICMLCPGPVATEFDGNANVTAALKGLSSSYVAKYAVNRALQGKLTIIPGFRIKAACFFQRFLPVKTLLRINYGIQRKKDATHRL